MANKIIIEGNSVSLVQETVKNCGTLENFIAEIIRSNPPSVDRIPHNCVAISSTEQEATYFVYVEPHMNSIKLLFDQTTKKQVPFNIFIPGSVWAIQFITTEGKYTLVNIHWHLVKDRPIGKSLSEITAYQNFLPNAHDITNNICKGDAQHAGMNGKDLQSCINTVIEGIENSLYTDHLMHGSKITTALEEQVINFTSKEKISKIVSRIEEINKALVDLEKSDWEKMTDAQIDKANKTRDKLTKERKDLNAQRETKNTDWYNDIFPFLEFWSKENQALIESNPDSASSKLLTEVFKYPAKGIRRTGAMT